MKHVTKKLTALVLAALLVLSLGVRLGDGGNGDRQKGTADQ